LVACIQSHRNPLQSIDRAPQQPLDWYLYHWHPNGSHQ
jgi:hypothetical protein